MIDKKKIYVWFSSGYTPEYTAILAKATSLSYSLPSGAEQAKQNAFIVALKSAGIWTHLDRLRVFKNGGNLNFTTIDWINPGVTPSVNVNTPTLDTLTGIASNGTTSYVNTKIVMTTLTKYTLNNASHFGYYGSTLNTNMFGWGVFDSVNATNYGTTATNTYGNSNDNDGTPITGLKTTLGLQLCQRISSTNWNLIQNGTTFNVSLASTAIPLTKEMTLCARNLNGSIGEFSTNKLAFWGCGDGLSGLESALKTAGDNFFNA